MASTEGGDGFGGDLDGVGGSCGEVAGFGGGVAAAGPGPREARGKSTRIISISKLFKRPAGSPVETMSGLEVYMNV